MTSAGPLLGCSFLWGFLLPFLSSSSSELFQASAVGFSVEGYDPSLRRGDCLLTDSGLPGRSNSLLGDRRLLSLLVCGLSDRFDDGLRDSLLWDCRGSLGRGLEDRSACGLRESRLGFLLRGDVSGGNIF